MLPSVLQIIRLLIIRLLICFYLAHQTLGYFLNIGPAASFHSLIIIIICLPITMLVWTQSAKSLTMWSLCVPSCVKFRTEFVVPDIYLWIGVQRGWTFGHEHRAWTTGPLTARYITCEGASNMGGLMCLYLSGQEGERAFSLWHMDNIHLLLKSDSISDGAFCSPSSEICSFSTDHHDVVSWRLLTFIIEVKKKCLEKDTGGHVVRRTLMTSLWHH